MATQHTRAEIATDGQLRFRELTAEYYAQQHPAEYYTCIEHSAEELRCEARLDERRFRAKRQKALEVGIEEYIWRTAGDGRVCPRCASYEGKKFRYDAEIPPPGGYPGLAAGCRCYPEPVIDANKLRRYVPPAKKKPGWQQLCLKIFLYALSALGAFFLLGLLGQLLERAGFVP